MWYGTFEYNLEYAHDSGTDVTSVNGILKSLVHFFDTWLMLFTSIMILVFNKKRRLAGVVWLFVSLFSIIWLLRSNGFAHYGLISLPLTCISFLELHKIYLANNRKGFNKFAILVISCYCIITMASLGHSYHLMRGYLNNPKLSVYRDILKGLPKGYEKSFIAYNCQNDLYLYLNIKPYYRFFVLQDFQSSMSPSLQHKMLKEFDGDCQWILVKGEPILIKNIINSKYYEYRIKPKYNIILYHLKK